jgi:hypothetical protein
MIPEGKTRKQMTEEAEQFWDPGLLVRVEKAITGANAHDARCWVHKYREACGQFGEHRSTYGSNAKWHREVLNIFANKEALTIRECQDIHCDRVLSRKRAK